MKRILILAALAAWICGCEALPTGYQPRNADGGYADMKLQEGVFRVSFKGNRFTEIERAEDLCLLRCADVALENGYQYFALWTERTYSEIKSHTTTESAPGGYRDYGYRGYMHDDRYADTRYQTETYSEPYARFVIECFKERPAGERRLLFDAAQVKENTGRKYALDAPPAK